jgi:YidC/Oxa1 family membrane protein insertase
MDYWLIWLDSIRSILTLLSSDVGLGFGFAIVFATIILRTALLPLAWPIAYRGCIRQKKMAKLQPKLKELKKRYADKPDLYAQKMLEIYKKHNLKIIDGKSLLGTLAQLPLFLGMFQVLRNAGDGVRFLWVPNLLRPDTLFVLIAGLTTALVMAANPDLPEQMRIFMIVLPSVIAMIAALKVSSALALYWATSNTFSAMQTVLLHVVVRRQINRGAVKI